MKNQTENPLPESDIDEILSVHPAWQKRTNSTPLHPISLFNSSEHEVIGDNLILPLSRYRTLNTSSYKFSFKGFQLSFGQLIALAGDFYGVPKQPISTAQNPVKAFKDAFATLDTDYACKEVPLLLKAIDDELAQLHRLIAEGKTAAEAYALIDEELNSKFNVITGGEPIHGLVDYMQFGKWGRYMYLADENLDHFNHCALISYKAGLQAAMEKAIEASSAKTMADQDRLLMDAYAMLGFANHFLTDLFSAGHLRTPRKELYDAFTPLFNIRYFKELVGLLAKGMHDEDNYNGLWVKNAKGHQWIVYGDARYREEVNSTNRTIVRLAVQASINDVFKTFSERGMPEPESLKYIPYLLFNRDDRTNNAPMFSASNDNGAVSLYMRTNFYSLQDYNLTRIGFSLNSTESVIKFVSLIRGIATLLWNLKKPMGNGAPASRLEVKGPDASFENPFGIGGKATPLMSGDLDANGRMNLVARVQYEGWHEFLSVVQVGDKGLQSTWKTADRKIPGGWEMNPSDVYIPIGKLHGSKPLLLVQSHHTPTSQYIGLISPDGGGGIQATSILHQTIPGGWTMDAEDAYYAVGDINGDGRSEILVHKQKDMSDLAILGSDGHGGLTVLMRLVTAYRRSLLAGAKFYPVGNIGDGTPGILMVQFEDKYRVALLKAGTNGLDYISTSDFSYSDEFKYEYLGIGDIDNDGIDELLIREYNSHNKNLPESRIGIVKLSRNLSLMPFFSPIVGWTLNNQDKWYVVGDINNDGKSEILVQNGNTLAVLSWDQSNSSLRALQTWKETLPGGWKLNADDKFLCANKLQTTPQALFVSSAFTGDNATFALLRKLGNDLLKVIWQI
jgi:hypothetical protein